MPPTFLCPRDTVGNKGAQLLAGMLGWDSHEASLAVPVPSCTDRSKEAKACGHASLQPQVRGATATVSQSEAGSPVTCAHSHLYVPDTRLITLQGSPVECLGCPCLRLMVPGGGMVSVSYSLSRPQTQASQWGTRTALSAPLWL